MCGIINFDNQAFFVFCPEVAWMFNPKAYTYIMNHDASTFQIYVKQDLSRFTDYKTAQLRLISYST